MIAENPAPVCSICQKTILPDTSNGVIKDDKGEVYWDGTNNASPINDGRCCNECNITVVIPARIQKCMDFA